MVEKVEFKQLGEKLREARENKDISLEEIAEETKINLVFLENFENGEFDFLPEFYIRHFLKSYLNCIGKSAMHFLDEFEQLRKQAIEAEQSEKEIETPKNSPKILHILEMIGMKGVSALKSH